MSEKKPYPNISEISKNLLVLQKNTFKDGGGGGEAGVDLKLLQNSGN